MSWATHKSGLILHNREIQRAYSDADYERWIKRRAPFQLPFIVPLEAATTLIGTPKHVAPATSGSGTATGITCAVNDVIVVCADDADASQTACTASSGVTATMTSQVSGNQGSLPNTRGSIWTGQVTAITTGALTIAVTSGGSLSWTAFVFRGLSSATASATMVAATSSNPNSGTLNTTGLGTCTFVVAHANLAVDVFTSWLGSPTITQPSGTAGHDTGQSDAHGYSLDVAAGSYTVGNNQSSGDSNSVTLAIALPVTAAGGTTIRPVWHQYMGGYGSA